MATLRDMFNNNTLSLHPTADIKNTVLSEYELIRQRNVAENKSMLDKLLAELKEELPPLPTPPHSVLKNSHRSPRNTPKKRKVNYDEDPTFSLRCNLRRSSRRPVTRSNPGVMGSTDDDGDDDGDDDDDADPIRRLFIRIGSRKNKKSFDWSEDETDLLNIDRHRGQRPRITATPKIRPPPPFGKSADDITELDLDNVSQNANEKKYCQVRGSTCHQCRQKTVDQKTICRSGFCVGVRGQFCGPCLKNRYGEDARLVLKDPVWSCPPCRGDCNCSICRNREGLPSTGILAPIARRQGYQSVQSLLDHWKNTFEGFSQDGIKFSESHLKEMIEDSEEFTGFTQEEISSSANRVKKHFIIVMCKKKHPLSPKSEE